ncbi:hypothetical protein QL285_051786 [Trifolium repens]|nr:hypothetical protein QL285_051786 [Trifolium repens]
MPKPKKHGAQPTPAHSLTELKLQHELTGAWNCHRRHHDLTHHLGGMSPQMKERVTTNKSMYIYIGAKDVHITNFHIHKRKLFNTKAIPTNGLIYIMHT